MIELDFRSKEPEFVASNNCFALVSQCSDRGFDEGNCTWPRPRFASWGMLPRGFDTKLAQATD